MLLRTASKAAKRRTRRFRFILLAPMLIFTTSCSLLDGSSGTPASGSPSNVYGLEKPVINVGYIPTMGAAPFIIALHDGHFQQEGLTVHAVPLVNGTDNMTKLLSGGTDIGYSDIATLLEGQAKGTGDFRIVAPGSAGTAGYASVLAAPGSGITSVRNLIGRTVSANALDDLQILALKANMEANDVNINQVLSPS